MYIYIEIHFVMYNKFHITFCILQIPIMHIITDTNKQQQKLYKHIQIVSVHQIRANPLAHSKLPHIH